MIQETKLLNDLKKGIHSRARYVSRKYPELAYEDLTQDANVLALTLFRSKSTTNVKYISKAIHNYFNNLMRNVRRHSKKRIPMTESITKTWVTDPSQVIDNRIDRERFLNVLKDDRLRSIINELDNGFSVEEIAAKNNLSKRSIYRIIQNIANIYSEWEGIDD